PRPQPQLVRRGGPQPEGRGAGEGSARAAKARAGAVLTLPPRATTALRDPSADEERMREALAEFLRHLGVERNASAHTVKSYREDLPQALGFFQERLGGQDPRPAQLTTRLLRAYLAWLHEQGYARSTVARRLAAVRSWCRFLCRQGVLSSNPALGLRG